MGVFELTVTCAARVTIGRSADGNVVVVAGVVGTVTFTNPMTVCDGSNLAFAAVTASKLPQMTTSGISLGVGDLHLVILAIILSTIWRLARAICTLNI